MVSEEQFDIAIAGGGPAGSSAAVRLSQAGFKVLLVEQKKFPREKLCGEYISPECSVHFEELGVTTAIETAGGSRINEICLFGQSGRGARIESSWFDKRHSYAIGLSRAALDLLLMDRARELGVDVREECSVIGVRRTGTNVSGLVIQNKGRDISEVRAKLMIDATGRSRSLARRAEADRPPRSAAKFVAFKTHLRGATIADAACELYAYRGGYGGCNRIEEDLYNLCFIASTSDTKRLGSDADRLLREVVFGNRRAYEAMKNASIVKPWIAVPIERYGRRNLVPADGVITLGDAAAFIDPFTGSGILMALDNSKIATQVICEYFWGDRDFEQIRRDYEGHYASNFDSRLRLSSIMRMFTFAPFLADALIVFLRSSRSMRRALALATRS